MNFAIGQKRVCYAAIVSALVFLLSAAGFSTVCASDKNPGLPRVIRFSGIVHDDIGKTLPSEVTLTFSLYGEAQGGEPLWVETQNVMADEQGRYTVLLGSASAKGMPLDVFSGGNAKWLGVRMAKEGSAEDVRVRLVSVPYAISAINADTFAGRPITDFMLTRAAQERDGTLSTQNALDASATINDGSSAGAANFLAKFETSTSIVNSAIFESSGNVVINGTSPAGTLTINGGGPHKIAAVGPQGSNVVSSFVQGTSKRASMFINSAGIGVFEAYQDGVGPIDFAVNPAGGNVGIGTPSPAFPLTVQGPGAQKIVAIGPAGNNVISAYVGGTNQRASMFINGAGIGVFEAFNDGIGPMNFAVNPAGGNVGINTANPIHALTVNGVVTSLKSNQQRTSMYVNNGNVGILESYNEGVGPLNLAINPAGGNIGIGTLTPASRVEIVGSPSDQLLRVTQNISGAGSFSVASPPPVAIRGDATTASGVTAGVLGVSSAVLGRGVLGESLATSGQNMGVFGVAVNSPDGAGVWGESTNVTGDAVGVFGRSSSNSGTGIWGEATATIGDAVGVAGRSLAAGGTGVQGEVSASTGENYAISGRVFNSSNSASTAGMFINTGSGSLLVGRTSTALTATNVFRVDGTGKGFFNGGTQMSGADFAESVSIKDEKEDYEPGDVIAIDTTGSRRFSKVSIPYSGLVAGIYSTKPGVLATPHSVEDPRIAATEIPLAIVGIVPCKVTNENGQIKTGDLLVASSRSGYAMKGTDRKRMTGAIIGKALQNMNTKASIIEVLVSLQ